MCFTFQKKVIHFIYLNFGEYKNTIPYWKEINNIKKFDVELLEIVKKRLETKYSINKFLDVIKFSYVMKFLDVIKNYHSHVSSFDIRMSISKIKTQIFSLKNK